MSSPCTYLVDGNNVMAQRVGWHRDRAGARRRLVRQIESFGPSRAIVVFDGSPEEGETWGPGSVEVVFAGPATDADTWIVEWASARAANRGLVAVTSDRELLERLAEHGVRSIRSGEFRRMLGEL